ncbi:MAG: hypothetical protein AUK31_02140 [Fibrobacteres bacterium CG2_30_45_31]|nr:MAG: hypothetical protein AUK31_02140 [Fibrobacteres bacterium CG2_30_45_31]
MSVQVMLFKDRLEIWSPGSLPPSLTSEKLKGPHPSVLANTLSSILGLKRRVFQTRIDDGVIEYTLPEKLNRRLQKYRLTNKGRTLLKDEI